MVFETKIRPPRPNRRWIQRPELVARLVDSTDARLVLLDAPVGYGKTVLMAQWMTDERERRPFVWLTLDGEDRDPARLLSHLVAAIRRTSRDFPSDVLPAASDTVGRGPIARIVSALWASQDPAVLVFDDYNSARSPFLDELLKTLVDYLPDGVVVAVAAQSDPAISLARHRVRGDMLELRADDLRFGLHEADELIRSSAGLVLSELTLQELVARTEGWPAGIYLAALSLQQAAKAEEFVHDFGGTHRHVAEYLTEEVLRRLPENQVSFLCHTAILTRFCGELCDAVLGRQDSHPMLAELERSNLFLIPLDDSGRWFRYHRLFRDLLAAELARTQPAAAARLHARASSWFNDRGMHEDAIHHALRAGEGSVAASLIAQHWLQYVNAGQVTTVQHWLDDLGEATVREQPAAAVVGAWVAMLTGEPERAEELLGAATAADDEGPLPDGTTSVAAAAALIRAIFGHGSLDVVEHQLQRAEELDSATSVWRPWLAFIRAHLAYMRGELETSRSHLLDVLAERPSHHRIAVVAASAYLSLIETETGNADIAMQHALDAIQVASDGGLLHLPHGGSFAHLALGQALAAEGRLTEAHGALQEALSLRQGRRMSPWPTLLILLGLVSVRSALGKRSEARAALDQARSLLAAYDASDAVGWRADAAERRLQASARRLEFGERLTEQEAAVLQLLAGPLTQREIGAELYLSANTIKSHARAIYRKLGVSTRSEAVAKGRELGLL